MTWFSADDVVEGNTIEQLGARDNDTIPWSNEPEIILTEAYHLKYEGKVMGLVERRPFVTNRNVIGRSGRDRRRCLALEWSGRRPVAPGRFRQSSSTADLVDASIPAWTESVSVSTAFVSETYEGNRIDVRGGPTVDATGSRRQSLRDAGASRTISLGGEFAFRLTAFPPRRP